MVIDLDRCTACQACVVACQVENNIPPSTARRRRAAAAISWIRLVPLQDGEHGTRPGLRLVPLPCMHCERPPCTKVCPVHATQIDDEGLVGQIYARCIGCRYCTTACPYTVRHFNWTAPGMARADGAVAQPRRFGAAQGRRREVHVLPSPPAAGEGRGAGGRTARCGPGDYVPACVGKLSRRGDVFGDLDDPRSAVARLSESPRAFRLLEELGTEPKVIYLSKGESGGEA